MLACSVLLGARRPLALLSESRVVKCVRNGSVGRLGGSMPRQPLSRPGKTGPVIVMHALLQYA